MGTSAILLLEKKNPDDIHQRWHHNKCLSDITIIYGFDALEKYKTDQYILVTEGYNLWGHSQSVWKWKSLANGFICDEVLLFAAMGILLYIFYGWNEGSSVSIYMTTI